MDIERFRASSAGHLVEAEAYYAFVPNPLPPALSLNRELVHTLSDADRALGELAGVGSALRHAHLFIVPFMRHEAVLSSRIEGTQATLTDLYAYEASQMPLPGIPKLEIGAEDVQEVSNYVRALEHGLSVLDDTALDLAFIQMLHRDLLEGISSQDETPGAFRTRQNWIGRPGVAIKHATYVPPPVELMHEGLASLATYLTSAGTDYPPLVRLALMHYYFEAIHPFIDGNGRVGRLLVSLALCKWGLLPEPLLYLSAYLERNRRAYYEQLLKVSEAGDWQGWLIFFLRGVTDQARAAVAMSHMLEGLHARYRQKIKDEYKRLPNWTLGMVDVLFEMPYITSQALQERFEVSAPTANRTLQRLEEMGMVQEVTGRKRSRVYAALELLEMLSEAG